MVLSNLERYCVVAVLAERSQKAFEAWLEGLREVERQGLCRVGMDMWGPYRGIVKAKRFQAKIVADGFHVMKQLNDAIAKIRRNLQAKADKASYELLEGMRWILERNRTDLEPAEEAKLLAAFPELRTAYLLKEHFATLANKIKDRSQAELILQAWVYEAHASGIAQLVKFTQTLQHWWDELLNYFNEGSAGSVVEGLNNVLRGKIRRAFGYYVFENFRVHVMPGMNQRGNFFMPLPQI